MRPRLSPPPRTVPSASRTTLTIWAAHPARRITGPWRIENQNYAENYESFDLESNRGAGAGHGRHGAGGRLQLRRGGGRYFPRPPCRGGPPLVLVMAVTAQAGVYSYGGGAYAIPDGSLAGVSSQITISGASSSFSDISVAINVSGGYNGDLYAYLSYDGKLVPLLDRIGLSSGNPIGAAGGGMNVTLSDTGANGNIHSAGDSSLSGAWKADGQTTSPTAAPGSFSAGGGSITLDGTFAGENPNGTWTLFFADVSAGGGTSPLNGWSLDITAVPEPVNVALGIFAGVFLVVMVARSRPLRNQVQRWRVAVVQWIHRSA